eukprot:2626440-Rhodomonas_salina.2
MYAVATANQTLYRKRIKGVSAARRNMRQLVCAMVAAAVAARVGAQTMRGELLARQDMFTRVKSMQMQLAEMEASLSDGSPWEGGEAAAPEEDAIWEAWEVAR